jgi:hypothetical protein
MRIYGIILFIFIFYLSICSGNEVALVVHGRILKDSVSNEPMPNVSVAAFKMDPYLGQVDLETLSVAGKGLTDSHGYFSISVISSGLNGGLSLDDTIRFQYPGFYGNGLVKNIRNGVKIFDDTKKMQSMQCPLKPCVSQGDTIKLNPGETAGYYVNDGVFGSQYFPFIADRPDTVILPQWVKTADCTGFVCIQIQTPRITGVTECKFNKKLNGALTYTFRFFICVKNPVSDRRHRDFPKNPAFSYIISARHVGGNIRVNLFLQESEMISAQLFPVNGKILAAVSPRLYCRGTAMLQVVAPRLTGVYILKINGPRFHMECPVQICTY